jgi:hypothetical protein
MPHEPVPRRAGVWILVGNIEVRTSNALIAGIASALHCSYVLIANNIMQLLPQFTVQRIDRAADLRTRIS